MPHLPRYWRAFRLIKLLETCMFQSWAIAGGHLPVSGQGSSEQHAHRLQQHNLFVWLCVCVYVYMYNAHRPQWHDLLVRVHACHEVSDLARRSTLFDLDRASHCDSRRYGQTGAGKTYSMIGEASTLPYSSAYTRRGLSLVF